MTISAASNHSLLRRLTTLAASGGGGAVCYVKVRELFCNQWHNLIGCKSL